MSLGAFIDDRGCWRVTVVPDRAQPGFYARGGGCVRAAAPAPQWHNFGRGGKSLVRYDNESGKGDHRHIMDLEEPYRFVSIARLREDFEADVRRVGGADEKKD